MPEIISEAEDLRDLLDEKPWSVDIQDKVGARLQKVEYVLRSLISFYSRSFPQLVEEWKNKVPASLTLGELLFRLRDAEKEMAASHGHLYQSLFGAPYCVVDNAHWDTLDVIRFCRNVVTHVPPIKLPTPTWRNLLALSSQINDANDRDIVANLKPVEERIKPSDTESAALSRFAIYLALEWYYALQGDERFPDIQLHVSWSQNELTYRDYLGKKKSAKTIDASPFLGHEIFSRLLVDGTLIWIPLEETSNRVITKSLP